MGRIFVVFIRWLRATIPAVRRIRPFVGARLHEARGVALAGCFVLDLESARDRLPHRAQFHQVFCPVRLCGSFCLSGMDCGAGSGHDPQPAWNGGLENPW
jgi:hypothetical protein